MSQQDTMITWNDGDPNGKSRAIAEFSESIESYDGVSKANRNRTFLDIESNRSVRPGFDQSDYYAFRSDEEVPTRQKKIIKMHMNMQNKIIIYIFLAN